METVQGGVPPYGVKEALVVNGKMVNIAVSFLDCQFENIFNHCICNNFEGCIKRD